MTKLRRHLLFTAGAPGHPPVDAGIFPSKVRRPILLGLWCGLILVLTALLVLVLAWRSHAV